jgi:hypothetical protein
MKTLRKFGSKFSLRSKRQFESFDPVIENVSEEQGFPKYDPSAYERFEESLTQPIQYNEDRTRPSPRQITRILPGAPPRIFEEWGEPRKYSEKVNPLAQTNGKQSLHDGDVVQHLYGVAEISLFGPQFGISQRSRVSAHNIPEGAWEPRVRLPTSVRECGMRQAKVD